MNLETGIIEYRTPKLVSIATHWAIYKHCTVDYIKCTLFTVTYGKIISNPRGGIEDEIREHANGGQ